MTVGRRRSRKLIVLFGDETRLVAVRTAGALLTALALIGATNALQTAAAEGDTRTLSFHHLHTGETITVTYKRDGHYDQAALKKLDWFMRDWRRHEETHMDPHLFDLLWQVNREVGGQKPIEVICGYRAPGTNAMLRARSTGVAQNSQHINGQAIDFEIPGVPLEKIREVGLRLQRGGVGFYPTSGSPFVHMDTGTIRHWPRIARADLQRIFPDGRTVHIPSDGKPLRNYALALADVEARGKAPNAVSLAAARKAGIATGDALTASIAANNKAKPKRSFLASLFGGNLVEADNGAAAAPDRIVTPPPTALAKPVVVARIDAPRHVPIPPARPTQFAALASDAATDPVSGALASPANQSPFVVAGASAAPTALGYAAEPRPAAPRPAPRPVPARPMGMTLAPASFTQSFTAALSGGFGRADSPWLRAAMLTPSVSGFMSATPLTRAHMEPLAAMLIKPAQSVVMTFSADPHRGMVASHFSGPAIAFLATATFVRQQTASLR
jgi:uncharacterized protein YcbK (DUF882 family)